MNGTGSYFRDKTVFVTGASSGIGEELAWQLGQSGAKLTLAARRQAALENLADRLAQAGAPRPLVATPIPAWLALSTSTAVRRTLKAVARGKREQILTGHGKILVLVERFAPWMIRAVARRLAARPKA